MRCFIAAEISPEITEKLAEIQGNFKNYGIRLTEPGNFHFTLKFLGEIDEKKAKSASDAILNMKITPFDITLRGVGAFPNERFPHVIWAGCKSREMESLMIEIDSLLEPLGFPKEREHVCHITLARIKQHKDGIEEKLEQLENIEIGKMEVNCIKLKKSTLTKKGPIYEDLAKVVLGF